MSLPIGLKLPSRVYVAMDLLGGKTVRLAQGDYERATQYAGDPLETLSKYLNRGISHLHIVDLEGARDPQLRQLDLIRSLLKHVAVADSGRQVIVQVGGGIRDVSAAEQLLSAGASRVVIGSQAVTEPEMVKKLISSWGVERVTVALDVKPGVSQATSSQATSAESVQLSDARVALRGWKEQSALTIGDALAPLLTGGLKHVLCTDITRDGMLAGVNLGLYREMKGKYPEIEIQVSGGVGSVRDLEQIKRAGFESVILGRALYEGRVTLDDLVSQKTGGNHAL